MRGNNHPSSSTSTLSNLHNVGATAVDKKPSFGSTMSIRMATPRTVHPQAGGTRGGICTLHPDLRRVSGRHRCD
eukprot:14438953-Alexandrium_andersonii.AAC.1